MDVINYPCWDYSQYMLIKGTQGHLILDQGTNHISDDNKTDYLTSNDVNISILMDLIDWEAIL